MTRLAVTERRTWRCPRCASTVTEGVAPFAATPTCTCQDRYPHKPQLMTTTTEDSPS